MSDIVTGLYPSGKGHNTSFNVKSDFIKVFPSSWRGADFKPTEVIDPESGEQTGAYVVEGKKQFNPESVLNTEYNITRTAGGIKSFIDYAQAKTLTDERISKEVYDLKFFIEGYAFEIFNLDLSRYEYPDNDLSKNPIKAEKFDLYAGIRVGDLEIGDADLDDTKVLMPYYWTAINTPIPLDATLRDAYLIDTVDETPFNSILSELTGGVKIDDIKNHEDTTYIFTGLVLSTEPLQDNDNYYSLKLFENGELCYGNFWPSEVKGGRSDGKSTVIGKAGLKADVAHMLAVGQFNTTSGTDAHEKTIFAVGNGFDDNSRRNAFEVTGYTDNTGDFKSTVKAGGIKFTYSKDKEAINRGDIEALHLINERTEILEDGSGIIVNRPIGDTFKQHPEIGIHSYGNINLLSKAENNGSKLQFKDISWTGTHFDEKIISTFQVVEVATGPSNIIDPDARGLKITNVHEINEEALLFRPCNAGLVRSQLKTINKGIDIDNMSNYKHSIKIGLDNNESAALALADNKLVIKSDSNGEFIDNLKLEKSGEKENLYNIAGLYGEYNKSNSSNCPYISFDTETDTVKIGGDIEITGTLNVKNIDDSTGGENNLKTFICDLIYPVGSIYMTMENINPAAKFGGTWKQISQGRMLIGAGKTDGSDFEGISKEFGARQEGGYYNAQIRSHTHKFDIKGKATDNTTVTHTGSIANTSITHNHTIDNDSAHSHNIPVSVLSDPDDSNQGYLTDPQTFGTWDYSHDTGSTVKPSFNKGDYGSLFSHFNALEGKGWEVRYWQFFEEKGKQLIPTVSAGTWWPNRNNLNGDRWNKPGYVRTGYQYVKDTSSFSNFRAKCRDAWRDWFNIAPVDCGSDDVDTKRSWYPKCLFVHTEGHGGGDFGSWSQDNQTYRNYWMPYVRTTGGKKGGTTVYGGLDTANCEDGKLVIALSQGWYNDSIRINPYYTMKPNDGDFKIQDIWGETFFLKHTKNTVKGTDPHMDNIRDAFIMDWIRHHARKAESSANGEFFNVRKDDGAHSHTCENHTGSHTHTLTLDATTHNHNLDLSNLETKTYGTTDATNLPPYLVCYIWERKA